MGEQCGHREFDPKTDVEVLAEQARMLEGTGMLVAALGAWRAVLLIDGNYLPAWEASSRLLAALSHQDGKETP